MLATEGNVIHYDFIEKFICDLAEKYHILEIAVDRWNATHMIQNLEDAGFTMVPFGQGFASMSTPTKEFYRLLMEGQIVHAGHPVLRWMAGNVVIETDAAENIKVTKAIEYVIGCFESNTTKVLNFKKYLLATLFNAPSTIDGYYQAEVNHDFPQYASAR